MPTRRLLANLARKNGSVLLNAAIDRLLPAQATNLSPGKKRLVGGLVGTAAMRVATRSVPGAILVSGAVIAKLLYDRRHAQTDGSATGKGAASDKRTSKA